MLERQGPVQEEDWEAGLSNVQLTPDGSILPVGTSMRSSKLMPVVEDEEEVDRTLIVWLGFALREEPHSDREVFTAWR